MEGKRIYLQPTGTLISAINDLVEIQKGKITFSDKQGGVIHFSIKMYAFKWELQFAVRDIGQNRSQVSLLIGGEQHNQEKVISQEFALLDSILIGLAQIEITEQENKGTD